eukprot:838402-Rhodomonas_salina.2
MSGGKMSATKAEKHKLQVWDCRLSSFHTLHKADNKKMVLSYNIGYIIACGSALHVKYNRDLLCTESVVAGTM